MTVRSCLLLVGFGVILWSVGSVYYAYRGPHVLDATRLRYWVALALSSLMTAVVVAGVLKWLHLPYISWATAALLVALPGMLGEVLALSHLPVFMPGLHASSGGRYGAFLFAVYAVVLGMAEIVALRAAL